MKTKVPGGWGWLRSGCCARHEAMGPNCQPCTPFLPHQGVHAEWRATEGVYWEQRKADH